MDPFDDFASLLSGSVATSTKAAPALDSKVNSGRLSVCLSAADAPGEVKDWFANPGTVQPNSALTADAYHYRGRRFEVPTVQFSQNFLLQSLVLSMIHLRSWGFSLVAAYLCSSVKLFMVKKYLTWHAWAAPSSLRVLLVRDSTSFHAAAKSGSREEKSLYHLGLVPVTEAQIQEIVDFVASTDPLKIAATKEILHCFTVLSGFYLAFGRNFLVQVQDLVFGKAAAYYATNILSLPSDCFLHAFFAMDYDRFVVALVNDAMRLACGPLDFVEYIKTNGLGLDVDLVAGRVVAEDALKYFCEFVDGRTLKVLELTLAKDRGYSLELATNQRTSFQREFFGKYEKYGL